MQLKSQRANWSISKHGFPGRRRSVELSGVSNRFCPQRNFVFKNDNSSRLKP